MSCSYPCDGLSRRGWEVEKDAAGAAIRIDLKQ
jgi:hypothetical protein